MKKMNKYILNILFLFTFFSMFGQLEVYKSDTKNIDGILYFNNKPFTGILFSDDDFLVPNSCECTLKANYKNGLRDGNYQEWTSDGKLIKKAIYHLGIIQKSEEYNNEKLYKETIYKNAKPVEVTFFDENQEKQKIITYQTGEGNYITTYFKNGKIVKKDFFENHVLIKTVKPLDNFYAEFFDPINNKTDVYLVKFDHSFKDDSLKKTIQNLIKARTKIIKSKPASAYKLIFGIDDNIVVMTLTKPDEQAQIKRIPFSEYDSNQQLIDNINKIFPLYCKRFSVFKKTDNEILKITIKKGKKHGITKGMTLYVYDNDNKIKMSELKVIKAYSSKSYCNVLSYNEWLKKQIDNNGNIFIVE